jgi:hypothetical protein
MHLSKKDLLSLFLPFFIAYLVYYFSSNIINYVDSFFATHEKYVDQKLDLKMQKYLELESKQSIYKKINQDALKREESIDWFVDELFYSKKIEAPHSVADFKSITTTQSIEEHKIYTFKLQAVFLDDKTAIINDTFVKEGSKIDNALVKQIKEDSVLIQTSKGTKWLFLFQ